MKRFIQIKNISVTKHDTKILKNISINILEGEKIIIQGDSGSGKSTLLKSILFFEEFCEGEIKYKQEIINENNIDSYRLNFSFLSQKLPYFYETTKEFIYLPLKYKNNRNISITVREISEYLKIFNLDETLLSKEYNKLSDGEKQRICIIQSLLLNRKILVLDEVTSNLDKKNKRNAISLITESKRKTVITVSHDHYWDRFCTRKIIIDNGKIKEDISL